VSNFSSASFTVWRNNGTGTFVSPFTLPTSSAGSCMLILDYDRDGDMDLLGIDELDDTVRLFRQSGPSPAGVQEPSCAAALRIDNLGNRAGYGGARPHDVAIGGAMFVGVSGGANRAFLILIGSALEPGSMTTFGRFGLSGAAFFGPVLATDANGEATLPIPLPVGLPIGVSLGFQALVAEPAAAGGALLTNPEVVRTI
jgi:hypothetical protein